MTKLEQPIQSENQLQNDKETFDGEQKDDLAILEADEVHQDNSSVIEDDGVGSNTYLGKFNSVQDLENAYNSLQAEFTRKCQKLKMLEEDIALSKQKVQEDSNAQQAVYEKQDYQEKLNSFLTNYPNAKKYAKEMRDISKDEYLKLPACIRIGAKYGIIFGRIYSRLFKCRQGEK